MYHLHNWRVFATPGYAGFRLSGEVYGHPNFTDGQTIVTTDVVTLQNGVAQTRNSIYQLVNK